MLTLNQKMKCQLLKQNDCISKGGKQQNNSSFSFFINKFLSFFYL
jgi:hypothetical protein